MPTESNPALGGISSNPTEFAAAHSAGVLFGQRQAEVLYLPGDEGREDGIPFAFLNGQLISLKGHTPPRLGKMSPNFGDPASLIAYLNRYKLEHTLIFAAFDTRSATFTAIIDYPAPGAVSRKEHVASFTVQATEAWSDWLLNNDEWQSQDKFCEFIEKYRGIFVDPQGTAMLELARYIEGRKEGQFTFGKRLQTGDRELVWKENTVIAAGATGGGETTPIPEQVEISVAMFEGSEPVPVKAWLRIRVERGTVVFKFETQNLDNTVRAALNKIREAIRDETSLPVFLGDAGTAPGY